MVSLKNIFPITQVKKNLVKYLKQIESEPIVITKDGKAAGVLMGTEEYDSLMETLEILSDKELVKGLKKSEGDFKKGQFYKHSQIFGS